MKKVKLSTILISLGLFFFFFVLLFPYSKIKGLVFTNIYKATQVYVNAQSLAPAIFGWPGVSLYKANVIVPVGPGYLSLAAEYLTARVGLIQFFPPKPSVSMDIDRLAGGGSIWFKGGETSSGMRGNFRLQKVVLNPYYLDILSGALQGEASAEGDFNFSMNDLPKTTGKASFSLLKFRIPGQNLEGIVLPPMFFGDVVGQIQARNGGIEIGPFQIGSASTDIRGTISGDIRLGKTWMECFFNLLVKIQLSETYRNDTKNATFVSFLKTFELTPGDYALKWNASFQEMNTNIAARIPLKAAN